MLFDSPTDHNSVINRETYDLDVIKDNNEQTKLDEDEDFDISAVQITPIPVNEGVSNQLIVSA